MKIYYVGIHLERRVLSGFHGFSSYVGYFAQAETPEIAANKAKAYAEDRYKVLVTGAFPTLAPDQDEKNYELLIK
jgi:hypothetical protein